MPELDLGLKDFTNTPKDDWEPVGWRLFAYISWPNDQQRRDEFLATLNAKSISALQGLTLPDKLTNLNPSVPVSAVNEIWEESKTEVLDRIVIDAKGQLGLLAEAPGLDALVNETEKNVRGWITAGYILFMVFLMDKFHSKELRGGASVSKAVELLENHSGTNIPGNRKDIMNCWSDFKPVSHFGAALNILSVAMQGDAGALGNLFNEAPGRILSIAKVFQEFGLRFKAHGKAASILPDVSTWTIPEDFLLPTSPLNFEPLSAENLEILKAYKAAIKISG
jgi:hypothetical protein